MTSPEAVEPPYGSQIKLSEILRRVLIPIESLDSAGNALRLAARIGESTGAQLRVLHGRVWDPYSPGADRFYTESKDEAWAVIEQALASLWQRGAVASGTVIDTKRSGMADVILDEGRSFGADVLLLTTVPRRLSFGRPDQLFRQLFKRSEIPILLVYASRR